MKTTAPSIEPLEARIAPAMVSLRIVNPRTATYTDVDGDQVTVKVSSGTLTSGLFTGVGSGVGDQLQTLDLSAGGFDKASVIISAAKSKGGDGFVNVGFIDATGHDLGDVKIAGDLGRIVSGTGSAKIPALKSLTTRSIGRLGLDTQSAGGSLESDIIGPLGALTVAGDVEDAHILAFGAFTATIGPVTIGGSLIGGSGVATGVISSSGHMGPVKIGHDIIGGIGDSSGVISSKGKIASVKVGGSIIGGAGMDSGEINADLAMGVVQIAGDVSGGLGSRSGLIESGSSTVASVTIGGSLIGGAKNDSGEIYSGDDLGPVKIGGDVRAGDGSYSGVVQSHFGKIVSVGIGGSLVGGPNTISGEIFSGGGMGPVNIGGDVLGGAGGHSGEINGSTKLIGVTIGGSLIGGGGMFSGDLLSNGAVGMVKIKGDIRGGSGDSSGYIESGARLAGLAIGGSLIGGSDNSSGAINVGRDIGMITISHDLRGGTGAIFSGSIFSVGSMAGVAIGGSLIGASGTTVTNNATIQSDAAIGPVTIAHDIIGGSAAGTDSISRCAAIFSGLRLTSVTVGGSIISGLDHSAGDLSEDAAIESEADIGSITVHGSIIGYVTTDGASPVLIRAKGQLILNVQNPALDTDIAIGKLAVGGRVEYANIICGYALAGPRDADAGIGSVLVGGDWIASNLVAGAVNTASMNKNFGDANDAKISGAGTSDVPSLVSKIVSITIGGQVSGTAASITGGDHFGFVAQQFGALKIGGNIIPVAPFATHAPFVIGQNGDVAVHEIS